MPSPSSREEEKGEKKYSLQRGQNELVKYLYSFGVTRDSDYDLSKRLLTKGTVARDMLLCCLAYFDGDKRT